MPVIYSDDEIGPKPTPGGKPGPDAKQVYEVWQQGTQQVGYNRWVKSEIMQHLIKEDQKINPSMYQDDGLRNINGLSLSIKIEPNAALTNNSLEITEKDVWVNRNEGIERNMIAAARSM